MDNSFTFKQIWMIFFGFGYLVNHRSREIHRLYFKHRNCHIDLIADKNSEYVTRSTAQKLIKTYKYNGCRWCWPVTDLG